MRTLLKLKANLQKFKKYLVLTFYLLTKFYKKHKTFDKKHEKRT